MLSKVPPELSLKFAAGFFPDHPETKHLDKILNTLKVSMEVIPEKPVGEICGKNHERIPAETPEGIFGGTLERISRKTSDRIARGIFDEIPRERNLLEKKSGETS